MTAFNDIIIYFNGEGLETVHNDGKLAYGRGQMKILQH